MAVKRIKSDLEDVKLDADDNFSAELVNDDLFYWQASIKGPPGSPYEGGVFFLTIHFGESYPSQPPDVKFLTPIFHPNIDMEGSIQLEILGPAWSSMLSASIILVSIYSLLRNPNPYDAIEPEIAEIYVNDIEHFNEIAVEWTEQHAIESDYHDCSSFGWKPSMKQVVLVVSAAFVAILLYFW